MKIVLHQPEIPANTGNIGRTCVATNSALHLIEPLGFRLNEKEIKRAGMDYWEHLEVHRHMNYQTFLEAISDDLAAHEGAKIWYCTTKAEKSYTEVEIGPEDYLMFGKESAGIPEEILVENRAAGMAPGKVPGPVHPHPHGADDQFPKSFELRGDRSVRGPQTKRF